MTEVRSAAIVAVGSELLTPFRSDTHSGWLTTALGEVGIEVRLRCVVGDAAADLAAAVRLALDRADLLVTTGGLGPTADDQTREVVAEVLDRDLAPDDHVLAAIRARFERRGMAMPALNARQAFVPAGAEVLPNDVGTAPGLWIEDAVRGRIAVLLPGPARELKPMFDSSVAPRLRAGIGRRQLRRRVIAVTGLPESRVDELAQPVYAAFAAEIVPLSTTILASPGRIELHLSASGADMGALDAALESGVTRLAGALGGAVVSTDGRNLEAVVGDCLAARGFHLAVAESCTGGLVMGTLTDVPGSSAWLLGGVVAYDNAVKVGALDVPAGLIEAHGAVSEPVAEAMAAGARRRFGADVAVAVTGVAGPSGGTPGKPVGTVVIAVDGPSGAVRRFAFGGDRSMVRQFSVAAALDMVRRAVG